MKEEQQQLSIILLIVFIGFIGTSIAYPLFPPLFLHPTSDSIIPLSWHENSRGILLGLALGIFPLGQFIGSPILGGCSDRYSRKRILIISLVGSTLGYFLSALSIHFKCFWLLLLSRFLTGLMESNIAIARAMAADLENISKFKSFGRINAAASIGYVMGPLFGGLLSDKHLIPWFSFAFPFFLAMVFSVIASLLAIFKLSEKKHATSSTLSIWQRFNLIARFKLLFKSSMVLKYLLIISTIFTFSVDMFYEFGPVYLTGLWSITAAGIAIYTAALSVTLSIGNSWLPQYLLRYFSIERAIVLSMLGTIIIFALMVIFPKPLLAFIFFSLVGLTIGAVVTNFTIQISNSASQTIQGETLGTQFSLRMLGDALICFVGGFLIISSVIVPIALSCLIALIALIVYVRKFLYAA